MENLNAKEELERILKHRNDVSIACADIYTEEWGSDHQETHYVLKLNYDKEQYDSFMESLNFEYDSGYGGQKLFGIVWLDNNSWLSRGEYDGSEWWDWNQYPEYPDSVKSLKNTLGKV